MAERPSFEDDTETPPGYTEYLGRTIPEEKARQFRMLLAQEPRITEEMLADAIRIEGERVYLHFKKTPDLTESEMVEFPDDVVIDDDLILTRSKKLTKMAGRLEVGGYMYCNGCFNLERITGSLHVGKGLRLVNSSSLCELPDDLHVGGEINIDRTKLPYFLDALKKLKQQSHPHVSGYRCDYQLITPQLTLTEFWRALVKEKRGALYFFSHLEEFNDMPEVGSICEDCFSTLEFAEARIRSLFTFEDPQQVQGYLDTLRVQYFDIDPENWDEKNDNKVLAIVLICIDEIGKESVRLQELYKGKNARQGIAEIVEMTNRKKMLLKTLVAPWLLDRVWRRLQSHGTPNQAFLEGF